MIPLTTLYFEYIDRSKLTEQKNPFECILPPPSRGSEQQYMSSLCERIDTTHFGLKSTPS